jgi:hypothetical protein
VKDHSPFTKKIPYIVLLMIGEKEHSRENIRKGTITNPLDIPKRSG